MSFATLVLLKAEQEVAGLVCVCVYEWERGVHVFMMIVLNKKKDIHL